MLPSVPGPARVPYSDRTRPLGYLEERYQSYPSFCRIWNVLTKLPKCRVRVWNVLPKLPKCRVGSGKSYPTYPGTLPGNYPYPSVLEMPQKNKLSTLNRKRAYVEVSPGREITSTSAAVHASGGVPGTARSAAASLMSFATPTLGYCTVLYCAVPRVVGGSRGRTHDATNTPYRVFIPDSGILPGTRTPGRSGK